jgi:hypothetical protein
MDLERREEKLEEEQAQGLHSFDMKDLLVELEELHELMTGIESECVAEVMTLSRSVMEISDALVDLEVFPIRDIPERPQSARDVLTATCLVLERLWEECDSGASPWV